MLELRVCWYSQRPYLVGCDYADVQSFSHKFKSIACIRYSGGQSDPVKRSCQAQRKEVPAGDVVCGWRPVSLLFNDLPANIDLACLSVSSTSVASA